MKIETPNRAPKDAAAKTAARTLKATRRPLEAPAPSAWLVRVDYPAWKFATSGWSLSTGPTCAAPPGEPIPLISSLKNSALTWW